MAKRGGSVHVATTTRKYKDRTYTTHLLRRTYRDGDRVRHETLGNLSHLPAHLIELVRRGLAGERFVPAEGAFDIVRTRPHGHVAAVLGTLRRLGLDALLCKKRHRRRDLVIAMLVARILEPRSKLSTAQALAAETSRHTLGEVLDLEGATEDELYLALDWLLRRQPHVEKGLAKRHLEDGTLVLYDLTSTYFEGRCCPLARIGYSRDGKKNRLQIVFGLLCSAQGCPVAVEVFEGNTADPATLKSQVRKLQNRFGLRHVVIVGDRGMITEARIREDLKPAQGLDWITALRAPAIRRLVEEKALQLSLFDTRDLAEISSSAYPGERLVACLNPLLADERARKREALLQSTEKELQKIATATARKRRPLKGKDKIGMRVGKVLGRFKVQKHFRIEITDSSFCYQRDQARIAAEVALDGIYVIRTSLPKQRMSATDVVRSYKQLSRVERAFRCIKTVDLKVRPIFHRLADRVRAHVFLCVLAYYVEWHMRRALAPLLFDDQDPQPQSSPVAPARRSPGALAKLASRSTEDGMTVQSFRGLLGDLATLAKNRIRLHGVDEATFDMLTRPTPLQRRAFELLDVSPAL